MSPPQNTELNVRCQSTKMRRTAKIKVLFPIDKHKQILHCDNHYCDQHTVIITVYIFFTIGKLVEKAGVKYFIFSK